MGQANHAALAEHMAGWDALALESRGQAVKFTKLEKLFGADKKMLLLAWGQGADCNKARDVVRNSLVQTGVDREGLKVKAMLGE